MYMVSLQIPLFLLFSTMQTFKSYLTTLYGEHITSNVRFYKCHSIKRSRYINNLAFLKRCRDSRTIPPGLALRDPVRDHKSKAILKKASLALLRHWISTRSTLAHVDNQITTTCKSIQFRFVPS